jgi:hypothetical protein
VTAAYECGCDTPPAIACCNQSRPRAILTDTGIKILPACAIDDPTLQLHTTSTAFIEHQATPHQTPFITHQQTANQVRAITTTFATPTNLIRPTKCLPVSHPPSPPSSSLSPCSPAENRATAADATSPAGVSSCKASSSTRLKQAERV